VKLLKILLAIVDIGYVGYSCFGAIQAYLELNNVMEETVLGPTILKPDRPNLLALDKLERGGRLRDSILKGAAKAGILLDDRKVVVSEDEHVIRVVYSYPVYSLWGEPLVSIPMWLERVIR